MAPGADLGFRPGNRGARAKADGVGPVRRPPAPQDHPRAPGRGAALRHLARRPPQRLDEAAAALPAKRKLGEYFQENFYLTVSGNFRTQSLLGAMLEIGADRILFSTDWPFENIDHAADWFDAASISEADREKIGRTNARRLFKL